MRRALVVLVLFAACKGGDPVACENACRNYAKLEYWHQHDPDIAKAPPDQREAVRKKLLDTFENELERGIDACVTRCVSANFSDQTTCMNAAKTFEQAKACLKN